MTSPSSAEPQPISVVIRPGGWAGILSWIWPLLWFALLLGSSGLGIWAIALLTEIPPFPNCGQIHRFSADSDRLLCAKTKAASRAPDHLMAGLDLVSDWSIGHTLHRDADPLLQQWSEELLTIARTRVHQGQLDEAIEMVQHIPPQATVYAQAQGSVEIWNQEWETGTQVIQQVTSALNNRNWQDAIDLSQALQGFYTDYWVRQQFQALQQQISVEQQAWAQLETARSLGASDRLNDWLQALELAQTIDMSSQAWPSAQINIDRWSQKVLSYAFQLWELGDLDQAVTIVQAVPADLTLAPDAKDLLQLSHARKLADSLSVWEPKATDVLKLMEAIKGVEQITSDSPLYEQAQVHLADWRIRLQDLLRLQAATFVANLGQPSAYEFAIAQAVQVDVKRPGRQQAQTLIAHWQQQMERIQDRPYLRRAKQLAQTSTVEALQQAIAEASKVEPERALRIEAQSWIAEWRANIQIIEDQPILKQANDLASEGKLWDAIQVAQQISADRALYDQAQSAIGDWTARIQVAEDGPILARAKDLAYQGSFTRAINTASQIGPGRVLYEEAQSAIALWKAERAYIWSIRGDTDSSGGSNGSGDSNDSGGNAEDTSGSESN
ncbi:MAG: hypothetical protein AAFW84_12810 [Cyanobacteria bacterium J06635_15]